MDDEEEKNPKTCRKARIKTCKKTRMTRKVRGQENYEKKLITRTRTIRTMKTRIKYEEKKTRS